MLKAVERSKVQRQLVERVAACRYISKSARLRDLLLYLCNRVLDDEVDEIHEPEVGTKVFGRAPDYDTTIDNIVRVHASQLRKRLDQYFSAEGREEEWIIEIPKGNYAPVFRLRSPDEAIPVAPQPVFAPPGFEWFAGWKIRVLAALAVVFAGSTLYLLLERRAAGNPAGGSLQGKPSARLFWSQVFKPGQATDIVLDDAAVALYQELAGRPVSLSEYFDRSYLRKLGEPLANAKLDAKQTEALVTRRLSSYASSHLLWRLFQAAGPQQEQSTVYFARDYTFRGIKSDNVILLGNSSGNPWVEPFESRLGLRWVFQDKLGIYYPVDTLDGAEKQAQYRTPSDPGDTREGYCMVALLPNLNGTGKVLILAATGGSAANAGGDFLADEASVAHLRDLLGATQAGEYPYFEALLRIKSRSALPKDVSVIVCRRLRS